MSQHCVFNLRKQCEMCKLHQSIGQEFNLDMSFTVFLHLKTLNLKAMMTCMHIWIASTQTVNGMCPNLANGLVNPMLTASTCLFCQWSPLHRSAPNNTSDCSITMQFGSTECVFLAQLNVDKLSFGAHVINEFFSSLSCCNKDQSYQCMFSFRFLIS